MARLRPAHLLRALAAWWRQASRATLALQALLVLIALKLAASLCALAASSGHWPLLHDAPLMHYVAWRMAEGDVPYRDLFDFNLPGTYLVHRAVLALLGPSAWGFRLFDLGWCALTAGCIAFFCRGLGVLSAALGALLLAAYHFHGGPAALGQRDFLLCAPLIAGAGCVLHAIAQPARARCWLAGLGACYSVACLIKPHVLLLGLAQLAVYLRETREHGGPDRRALAWSLAGLALPGAAVALWLLAIGALGPFVDVFLHWTVPVYSALGRVEPSELLEGLGKPVLRYALWPIVPVALCWSPAHRPACVLALLGTAYGALHFMLQARGWDYHLYPFVAWSTVSYGMLASLARAREALHVGVAGGVSLCACALLLNGAVAQDVAQDPLSWYGGRARAVAELSAELRRRVRPEQRVQVLDTTVGAIDAVYWARRALATRHMYDFPLTLPLRDAYSQRLRREFMRELRARPPAAVVLSEEGWLSGNGYARYDAIPGFSAWLRTGYQLVRERDGFRLYTPR